MRPAIGITAAPDDRSPFRFSLREDYVRSVEQAGGLPLLLAPGDARDAAAFVARLDGLLLSGGSDLDPALYGAEPHPALGKVVRARDDFELALVHAALAHDLPLLAICRGQQVLNVALGGTLIQDIPSQVPGHCPHTADVERHVRLHDVAVRPGTRLHALLGCERVAVNSFHHQAIERLGTGLEVNAVSPADGLIEGVELPGRRFVLGAQWHPESFWRERGGFQPLFEALVQAGADR